MNQPYKPYPTFIPPDVCRFLGLTAGDAVHFEVHGSEVVLKKEPALDTSEPTEKEYYALAAQSMTEWLDDKDDDLLPPWKPHGTV